MNILEEEVLFFAEVGYALRQWAAVEGQLRALVSMSVHPTDGPSIAEGFMSIENFRSKLSFCDRIVRRRFGESAHISNWEKLFCRCQKLSGTRNRIAHGQHVLNTEGAQGRRWGIVDWSDEEPITISKGKATIISSALCLSNVVMARLQFRRLTGELASLQYELRGRPALPPVFLGPDPDAPDLRSSRNQIRRALGIQPLPLKAKSQKTDES